MLFGFSSIVPPSATCPTHVAAGRCHCSLFGFLNIPNPWLSYWNSMTQRRLQHWFCGSNLGPTLLWNNSTNPRVPNDPKYVHTTLDSWGWFCFSQGFNSSTYLHWLLCDQTMAVLVYFPGFLEGWIHWDFGGWAVVSPLCWPFSLRLSLRSWKGWGAFWVCAILILRFLDHCVGFLAHWTVLQVGWSAALLPGKLSSSFYSKTYFPHPGEAESAWTFKIPVIYYMTFFCQEWKAGLWALSSSSSFSTQLLWMCLGLKQLYLTFYCSHGLRDRHWGWSKRFPPWEELLLGDDGGFPPRCLPSFASFLLPHCFWDRKGEAKSTP